jgi:hypothetical protein
VVGQVAVQAPLEEPGSEPKHLAPERDFHSLEVRWLPESRA